ncbi:RNA polymerase II transcription factor b subunit 1 [Pseudohyphozyma bogoriensis]|nr:RNA polymerase II transcription factor b subunit 1 [Pseudohyphozyma bogoriensis]
MAGVGGIQCSAAVAFKKRPGTLQLSTRALTWSTTGGPPYEVDVVRSRFDALFSSKEGAAKVMLKVGVLPPTASTSKEPPPPSDDSYSFTFTAATANADRENFKREMSAIIASNREKSIEAAAAGDSGRVADLKGKGKEREGSSTPIPGSPMPGPSQPKTVSKSALKIRILQTNPALAALHRELVLTKKMVSEAEFWDGREDLLEAAAAEEAMRKGRSGEMVDPRPETGDGGEITVKITPTLIRDIFEEYPAVLRAYNENVPDPLDGQQFWTRYFQSKLFNRNRTTNRAAVNTIKDDPIFDKYLGEEDDDLEPKNLQPQAIFRLLDLAATEEDQHEVTNRADFTMRAGGQRASLPLMRRFNEHSERLLNQSLGTEPERTSMGIDPGNAGARNYYEDIVLDDLNEAKADDRILLQMGDRGDARITGREEEDGITMDDVEVGRVLRDTKESFDSWQMGVAEFEPQEDAIDAAMDDMLVSITHKAERSYRDGGSNVIPERVLRELQTIQASSNELLRQFWSAVLPPKANDISAAAMATPKEKAAKAERMKKYLETTEDRVAVVLKGVPGETRVRAEAALQPVREAVAHAIQYFESKTS